MSLGLNKTKRRISSVKSTQKITKAMEMVATVKLKRFRKSFDDDLLYTQKLSEVLAEIVHRQKEGKESPYTVINESKKGTLYIAITSNLGLCAGYNANLFRFLESKFDKGSDELIVLGNKGITHYGRLGDYAISPLSEKFDLAMEGRDVIAAAEALMEAYRKKECKAVKIVYKCCPAVHPLSIQLAPQSLAPASVGDGQMQAFGVYALPVSRCDEVAERVLAAVDNCLRVTRCSG